MTNSQTWSVALSFAWCNSAGKCDVSRSCDHRQTWGNVLTASPIMFCTPPTRSQTFDEDRPCALAPLVLPWGTWWIMVNWQVWLQLENLQCLVWVSLTVSVFVKEWKYAVIGSWQYDRFSSSSPFLSLCHLEWYFGCFRLFCLWKWQWLMIRYRHSYVTFTYQTSVTLFRCGYMSQKQECISRRWLVYAELYIAARFL